MASRGAARAVIGGLVPVSLFLAGCSLLFPGAGFDGDFPSSSPIAHFTTGRATIAVDGGEPIVLDEIGEDSGIDSVFGSQVRWSNDDGWTIGVAGVGADVGGGLPFGESAYLTLDRIADGKHLTTYDPTRCLVDIEVADATAFRGTAICKKLEWYDALNLPFGPEEPKDSGEPEFDAEITFEAAP